VARWGPECRGRGGGGGGGGNQAPGRPFTCVCSLEVTFQPGRLAPAAARHVNNGRKLEGCSRSGSPSSVRRRDRRRARACQAWPFGWAVERTPYEIVESHKLIRRTSGLMTPSDRNIPARRGDGKPRMFAHELGLTIGCRMHRGGGCFGVCLSGPSGKGQGARQADRTGPRSN